MIHRRTKSPDGAVRRRQLWRQRLGYFLGCNGRIAQAAKDTTSSLVRCLHCNLLRICSWRIDGVLQPIQHTLFVEPLDIVAKVEKTPTYSRLNDLIKILYHRSSCPTELESLTELVHRIVIGNSMILLRSFIIVIGLTSIYLGSVLNSWFYRSHWSFVDCNPCQNTRYVLSKCAILAAGVRRKKNSNWTEDKTGLIQVMPTEKSAK